MEGSDLQQSLRTAELALSEARAHSLAAPELASILQAGKSRRLVNDYVGALKAAQEGMILAETLKDEPTRGELLVLRGMVEWNQAKIPEATVSMMEALRLGDTLGNKHLRSGRSTAKASCAVAAMTSTARGHLLRTPCAWRRKQGMSVSIASSTAWETCISDRRTTREPGHTSSGLWTLSDLRATNA